MATPDRCGCKVGRVIEEFGLSGMDDELVDRRKGEEGRPESLRDLADYFNQAVVRKAIDRAGKSPLDGEVENIYRLLTDDDVGSGMRIRVRKQLEGEGVDLDAVEENFVSHPTMGRHLEDCLGVKPSPAEGDRTEASKARIFKMQSRAEAVIGNTLSGLGSAGRIAAGDLSVAVDAQVMCEECGFHGGIEQFIDRGGCDCEREDGE